MARIFFTLLTEETAISTLNPHHLPHLQKPTSAPKWWQRICTKISQCKLRAKFLQASFKVQNRVTNFLKLVTKHFERILLRDYISIFRFAAHPQSPRLKNKSDTTMLLLKYEAQGPHIHVSFCFVTLIWVLTTGSTTSEVRKGTGGSGWDRKCHNCRKLS